MLLLIATTCSADAGAAEHCVILQYQHISDTTPGVSSVTPAQFQEHLNYLLVNEYAVTPLEEVVTALKTGIALPDKCVALTVDGGYVSAYQEAFPRTRRYGFPLTLFIPTQPLALGYRTHLTWDQVREMQAVGVSIQTQGHSLSHLVRHHRYESAEDWERRVAVDIQTAQNQFSEATGMAPTLIAYPFGEYNPELGRIAGSMGLIGFGEQAGPVWPAADFTALPRFSLRSLNASLRALPRKLDSLPLPITGAFPLDPVVPLDDWRPSLTLVFVPGTPGTEQLNCRLNGSAEMTYEWLEQPAGSVVVTPRGRLVAGRNRVFCTMPIGADGREGWYTHIWLRRTADGSWYRESR